MLQHIKISNNSYFIDTNDIVYVNQFILNVEGMDSIDGAITGIDSLGTDFIKINDGVYDTYINRKRIIAITNKGVMLDKTYMGPVSIQFGCDTEKEFEKVMKYFDPSDYTEINGWYLVKNKIKTFIPTENNVNGVDMTRIKPVQPTPPTPPGPGPEPSRTLEIVIDNNFDPETNPYLQGYINTNYPMLAFKDFDTTGIDDIIIRYQKTNYSQYVESLTLLLPQSASYWVPDLSYVGPRLAEGTRIVVIPDVDITSASYQMQFNYVVYFKQQQTQDDYDAVYTFIYPESATFVATSQPGIYTK